MVNFQFWSSILLLLTVIFYPWAVLWSPSRLETDFLAGAGAGENLRLRAIAVWLSGTVVAK